MQEVLPYQSGASQQKERQATVSPAGWVAVPLLSLLCALVWVCLGVELAVAKVDAYGAGDVYFRQQTNKCLFLLVSFRSVGKTIDVAFLGKTKTKKP